MHRHLDTQFGLFHEPGVFICMDDHAPPVNALLFRSAIQATLPNAEVCRAGTLQRNCRVSPKNLKCVLQPRDH
jgi:hypothetical protein